LNLFKKIFLLLFIFLSLILNATEIKKLKLQLQWKHQFEFAGFYAAKEKGFYKDIGVDLNFIEYKADDNIVSNVLNKKANFGVTYSSLIAEYINGKPVIFLANYLKQIARDYDVLLNEEVALRGSFLIDSDGTVRHSTINDLPLGRNIDEMIRMVDTMIFTNENGEVCPAGWAKGDEGMKASTEGVAEYLANNENNL